MNPGRAGAGRGARPWKRPDDRWRLSGPFAPKWPRWPGSLGSGHDVAV